MNSNKKLTTGQKKFLKWTLVFAGAMFALAILIPDGESTEENGPRPEPKTAIEENGPRPEPKTAIEETGPRPELETAIETSGGSIIITNLTNQTWRKCTLDINRDYTATERMLPAKGRTAARVMNFTDDGRRFNALTHRINEVGITCREPVVDANTFSR